MPGPAVWTGGATSPAPTTPAKGNASAAPPAAQPTTMKTVKVPAAAPTKPVAGAGGAGCAAMWGQCGGSGFSGASCCSAGSCKAINKWYSQCRN